MAEQRDDNKRILLFHRMRSVKTLKDFMERERINFVKADDVFEDNRDFIFQQMSLEDKNAFKEQFGTYPESGSDLQVDMTLPCPCKIKVNPYGITAEIAISQTNLQTDSDDFFAFAEKEIAEINEENAFSEVIDKSAPGCRIYVWTKTDYRNSMERDSQGNYISSRSIFREISQDIISINTNTSANGSSFSIRLPIIDIVSDVGNTRSLETNENLKFKVQSFISRSSAQGTSIVKSNFLNKFNFYETLLSNNDLIFISFNPNNVLPAFNRDAQITEEDIANFIAHGNFDMIGLIDSIKTNRSSTGAQASVDVTGRDLMKLLIEDGSFFFNLSIVDKPSQIFDNTPEKQGDIMDVDYKYGDYSIRRLRGAANELDIFRNPLNNSIAYIMKGVISRLANVEIVPGKTFTAWDDKTTFNDLIPEENE